ncbi:ComF family protein [Candidatus Gottesmanbacteria bacterium]|nr:ComF family protein [Candidatus Gottesmanbacteria bacterium]
MISVDYHCPENLDGIFVLAHYDGIIRKAIKEVKYRGKYAILSELAEMFPKEFNFNFDYLVPVPLSKKRLTDRGFNQAEKLANALARSMNYELRIKVLNCLVRVKDTKPQFNLNLTERQENVKNAFIHNSKFIIHNSNASARRFSKPSELQKFMLSV